ncbi:hypothetical protein CRV15_11690 [Streptomyces clavuligerus]|nr:hypothetical protein D1794_12260 [Streptomyces clavuligerus]QCS06228.1 hypothetical protein CRV15_11690 [Streptomyces clavuligerus]QPJ94416.1 hypothetical protein GE265_16280 [Streptomyces clavuligerus]
MGHRRGNHRLRDRARAALRWGLIHPPAPGWAVCPWWGVQGRPRKGPAENRPPLDIGRSVCRP